MRSFQIYAAGSTGEIRSCLYSDGESTGEGRLGIPWPASKIPACRIFGVELNPDYLALAERKARAAGFGNVAFIAGRAEEVRLKGRFDCITSSYLAKYADIESLIEGAAGMLRSGGVLVMHDFTYPRAPPIRGALGAYFRIMRRLGGRAFPDWKTVFLELEDFLAEQNLPQLLAPDQGRAQAAIRGCWGAAENGGDLLVQRRIQHGLSVLPVCVEAAEHPLHLCGSIAPARRHPPSMRRHRRAAASRHTPRLTHFRMVS